MATRAPSWARASAIARPTRRAAPVTRTTLPLRSKRAERLGCPGRAPRGEADQAVLPHQHDASLDSGICTGARVPLGGYADRCGYGPRLPLLVISPYSRTNFVDHPRTDQTSVLRFIEDNWRTGRIGDASYDSRANALSNMFSFRHHPGADTLTLDPGTGARAGR